MLTLVNKWIFKKISICLCTVTQRKLLRYSRKYFRWSLYCNSLIHKILKWSDKNSVLNTKNYSYFRGKCYFGSVLSCRDNYIYQITQAQDIVVQYLCKRRFGSLFPRRYNPADSCLDWICWFLSQDWLRVASGKISETFSGKQFGFIF